jgi:hypothetical protein
MIGVCESAVTTEALFEELEETIRVTVVYTGLHKDLGKLEVLARVKKQVPQLRIDRGKTGGFVFMLIVHKSLCFWWSPAIWVVLSGEFVNRWVSRRANCLID